MKHAPPGVQVDRLHLRSPGALSPAQARAIGDAFAGHLASALGGAGIGHVHVAELVLDLGTGADTGSSGPGGPASRDAQLQRAAARVARRILDHSPD